MRFNRTALLASSILLAAIAAPLACGGGGSGGSTGTGATTTTTTTSSGTGGQGGDDLFDAGSDDIVSIAISPDSPTIEVLNGVAPAPTVFTAKGTTKAGAVVDLLNGSWEVDRLDLGSINASTGAFTASGLVGGTGKIKYSYGGSTGTTSATIKLHFTSEPQPIDPSIKGQFGTAGQADPAMSLLYPYDKTVFPRGLLGPTLQWNGGSAADTYYLHATSPTFEYEAWTAVPPPSRYDLPAEVWKKLTDSVSGPITFTLQRHDGSQAYLGVTRTFTIAPANLAGTIYFWEVNSGNVVRINPGDNAPQDFLQKPPGETCVACHSVSKNGSRLVASFKGGYSPWGTFDAATGASLYSSGLSSGFQAISPTGSHVLWRHWNDGDFNSTGYLSLSTATDATELLKLQPGGGAPSHPSWSGDGKKVAFSMRTNGNGLDFTQSSLWITDVDLAAPSFSNTHQIIPNDGARPTLTYPTFSPDSQWIAFERSTQARSRGAVSDVWLTSPDGATQFPLENSNGTGLLTGAEASSNYEPTFMPVAAGGYFWLVIVSERTYGNTLVDLNPQTRHKQLWVTAIDAVPTAGQDPSHPAFWLPGQALDNNNMRGEWALSPCKMIGQGCSAGFECCDGFCHDDGMGNLTCTNSGGGCSQIGEACKTAADCCDPSASCVNGFCADTIPH